MAPHPLHLRRLFCIWLVVSGACVFLSGNASANLCVERLPGGAIAASVGEVCAEPESRPDFDHPCVSGDLAIENPRFFQLATQRIGIAGTKVSLEYVFRNTSDSIQTAKIKFSLPHVTAEYRNSPSDRYAMQLQNMRASVDGQNRGLNRQTYVISKGSDKSALLRELGFAEQQIENFLDFYQNPKSASAIVDDPIRERLIKEGMLVTDNQDLMLGWPTWHLEANVFWHEDFKPRQEKTVRLSFSQDQCLAEWSGSFYYRDLISSDELRDKVIVNLAKQNCLDNYSFRMLRRKHEEFLASASKVDVFSIGERQFAFRLDNGGYAKPVDEFRFTLQKERDEMFISGCQRFGHISQSNRTFVLRARNLKGKGTIRFHGHLMPARDEEFVKRLQEEKRRSADEIQNK